jgi:hypothetical protein
MYVGVAAGGIRVGVFEGVLVAAAAVSAAEVASSSSGEGPQDDNKMHNSIKTNPGFNFLVKNIINLLLITKWILRN